jgi:GrpB-like predicted nucleotidyltransferase (UPF0157 family)
MVLVDYNANWPILFEEEKNRVLSLIGNKVLAVEHIGSTAVPSLGAKPIIDMMAGVQGPQDAEKCIPLLRKIGYTSFTPDLGNPDHYYCCGKEPHSVGYHLHLIKFNSNEWRKHLLFRDYLRTNPEILRQYYKLKMELAEKYHSDRGGYTSAKSSFIESVVVRAKKELVITDTNLKIVVLVLREDDKILFSKRANAEPHLRGWIPLSADRSIECCGEKHYLTSEYILVKRNSGRRPREN